MGQFIQDGNRILFETVMNVETSKEEIIINEEPVDLDGLNYLAGKTVDFINKSAMNGTILAHTDGNVPNLIVNIPEQNEYYLGQLFYFFEFACVDFINKSAMNGTILAHTDGNVPNLIVNIPEQNEYYLGQLFYFFEFACGISGYLLGVNPFNQPGVESYKKNMFTDGNVPNLIVNIPEQNEYYLGQLFYFFEFACGISGYLLGVNPFNQPGVESYKKNMFALLGKPGFEAEREELLKRL